MSFKSPLHSTARQLKSYLHFKVETDLDNLYMHVSVCMCVCGVGAGGGGGGGGGLTRFSYTSVPW